MIHKYHLQILYFNKKAYLKATTVMPPISYIFYFLAGMYPFLWLLSMLYDKGIKVNNAKFLIGLLEKENEAWASSNILDIVQSFCYQTYNYYHLRESPYESEKDFREALKIYTTKDFYFNYIECEYPWHFEIFAIFQSGDTSIADAVIVKVRYTEMYNNKSGNNRYFFCRHIDNRWQIQHITYNRNFPAESYVSNQHYLKMLQKKNIRTFLMKAFVFLGIFGFFSLGFMSFAPLIFAMSIGGFMIMCFYSYKLVTKLLFSKSMNMFSIIGLLERKQEKMSTK